MYVHIYCTTYFALYTDTKHTTNTVTDYTKATQDLLYETQCKCLASAAALARLLVDMQSSRRLILQPRAKRGGFEKKICV